jgi:hypothetical protein
METSPRHSHSADEKGRWDDSGFGSRNTAKRKEGAGTTSASSLLSAMQRGVGGVSSRKVYSLAPCHHLFVSTQPLSLLIILTCCLTNIAHRMPRKGKYFS